MNSIDQTPPFSEDPEEPQGTQPQEQTRSEERRAQHRSANPGRVGQFGILTGLQIIITYAFLAATLFTLFTPNNLFSGQMVERLFSAWQANPTSIAQVTAQAQVESAVNHIGIVAGHWQNDSGSVCSDGLTEQEVNLKIATLVQQKLTAEGYTVDLLSEFDSRLSQYKAVALISIHNDSCTYINDSATGFKVAAAMHSAYPEKASRLTACLIDRYSGRTGLPFHANTITNDMTNYHAFDEINSATTAAIIETGFLNLDRKILTENTDLVAQGIVDGINCFLRNESISPTATVLP
ncbi:MAG: N-acetylmuramoyl-L-alanine amidase [Anaerolineaceae bacterium]